MNNKEEEIKYNDGCLFIGIAALIIWIVVFLTIKYLI